MSATATTFPQEIVNERTVDQLSTRSKVLIGGVGALTPIILNLLVVDLNTTFATLTVTFLVVLFYLVRVGILFAIGGAMAYFHKSETSAIKLFEIGIVAPAMLTALINGTTNNQDTNARVSHGAPTETASVMDLFMPTAHAQTKDPEIKQYSLPEDSVGAQIWQGLSGKRTERVWFVVAGTYELKDLQKARDLVGKMANNPAPFKPQIYKNDKYYAVVIGANLTLAQARDRKEKAYAAKVPQDGDIYLYNPWETKGSE